MSGVRGRGEAPRHWVHDWASSAPPFLSPSLLSVPPTFPLRKPRTLTVIEGRPARLSCECQGVPFPQITWKKDGRFAALLSHTVTSTQRSCFWGAPTERQAEIWL